MSAPGFPVLRIALPGQWAQVPLSDARRVERAVQLLGESGADRAAVDGLRAELAELAAAGGDQLYLREDGPTPTVLVTAWPPTAAEGVDGLRGRLGQLGAAGVELAHRRGYALLRTPLPGLGSTYWLAHPTTARVLSVTVVRAATGGQNPGAAAGPDVYEVVVSGLTWEEPGA